VAATERRGYRQRRLDYQPHPAWRTRAVQRVAGAAAGWQVRHGRAGKTGSEGEGM